MPQINTIELWIDYLELLNLTAKIPGSYHTEDRRTQIHNDLFDMYSELFIGADRERFDNICHNLDKVIDFNPPLEKYDPITFYAVKIARYMEWYKGKKYILKQIDKF